MYPILLQYNGLIIVSSFGLFLTLGFIAFMLGLMKFAMRIGVPMDFFSSRVVSLFLVTIAGAKGLYWLCNYDVLWTYISSSLDKGEYSMILAYLFNIKEFYVWGGLLSFGGLFYFYVRKNNQHLLKWLDALLPSLHISFVFGFLGSFLAGYYVGKPSPSFPGMVFTGDVNLSIAAEKYIVPIHPIQLYSLTASLIIFFILLEINKKIHTDGVVGTLGIFLLSIQVLLIEFLRGSDNIPIILGLTLNQYFAIGGIGLAIYLFTKKIPRITALQENIEL